MRPLKLGSKMRTVNLVQEPAQYALIVTSTLGTSMMPVMMDSPIKQLRRVVNLYEELGSFAEVSKLACVDVNTGVESWELNIK